MAAKSHTQRIIILTIVGVFFLTSVAFTGFVIWDNAHNNSSTVSDLNSQLQQQQNNQNNQENSNMLKGTKLQNFTPVDKVTELQKIDLEEGTGDVVQPGATITANYTGALAKDGTIFESSLDSGQPATFPLDGVIKGWTEGVPGMKVGGKRRLIIPADMAYGAQGSATIPANSDLVFDIELIKIGE